MTPSELTRLTDEWTERLRLQDWNIDIDVVGFLEAYGDTAWDRYKNAHIRLCAPDTLPPMMVGCGDLEVTLVHELLHLHGTKLSKTIEQDSPEDDALEEMIEILAQTFVTMRRELDALKKSPKHKNNAKKRPTGKLLPPVKDTGGKDRGKAGKAEVASRTPQAVRTNKFVRRQSQPALRSRRLRNKVR